MKIAAGPGPRGLGPVDGSGRRRSAPSASRTRVCSFGPARGRGSTCQPAVRQASTKPGPIGAKLVTADAHAGPTAAVAATLPGAAWQRCRPHDAANLMSTTRKRSWAWVKAPPHSVSDQADAASVHAQVDCVADALAEKPPRVAEHLANAREDLLALTAFPQEIWRQIRSNNPNERLD